MSSLRKDSGVAKAAMAARRRRVAKAPEDSDNKDVLEQSYEIADEAEAVLAAFRQRREQAVPVAPMTVPPRTRETTPLQQQQVSRPTTTTTPRVSSQEPARRTVAQKTPATVPPRITGQKVSAELSSAARRKGEDLKKEAAVTPMLDTVTTRRARTGKSSQGSVVSSVRSKKDRKIDKLPPRVSDSIALANSSRVRLQCHSQKPWNIGGAASTEPTTTKATVIIIQLAKYNENQGRKLLAYGDVVRLVLEEDGRVLGVGSLGDEPSFNVSWMDHGIEEITTWRLERAIIGQEVPVGVLERMSGDTGDYVSSGAALLLRNEATGGLLSVTATGDLQLVTDSYNADDRSKTSRGALVDHPDPHVLVVSPPAVFHAVAAATPPTALWPLTERQYMTGRLDPQRLNRTKLDEKLFVSKPDRVLVDNSSSYRHERESQLETCVGQEQVLIDELIGSFWGLEGEVFVKRDGMSFSLGGFEQRFDAGLLGLAKQILPLGTAYLVAQEFVAIRRTRYEYGRVMHALCAEVDGLLQEYMESLRLLDVCYRSGDVRTLHDLQVQIRPALGSMMITQEVLDAVRPFRGGALINALRDHGVRTRGNHVAQVIIERLLSSASAPYIQIAQAWLNRGKLVDPHEEFLVKKHNENDDWESQYTVVNEHVLDDFAGHLLDRVVATGKYWNAIHVACPEYEMHDFSSETLYLDEGVAKISSYVNARYRTASKVLVRLLMKDYDLLGSLRLMRRYFLLEHGDFFVHFLDAAEVELNADLPKIARGQVQHWLDNSVSLTEKGSSPGRRDSGCLAPRHLRCAFVPDSLVDQLDQLYNGLNYYSAESETPRRQVRGSLQQKPGLSGLQAFALDISIIPFPLSLVLTEKARGSYQLLFRLMFLVKHAERRLVSVWQDHQTMKEMGSLRQLLGRTFLVRQKMLHFVQNFMSHIFEAVGPNWEIMVASIATSRDITIDTIILAHTEFLRKTFQACLLVDRESIRNLTKILATCNQFCDQMDHFMEATHIDVDRRTIALSKQAEIYQSLNKRVLLNETLSHNQIHLALQTSRNQRRASLHKQGLRIKREIDNESFSLMISGFDKALSQQVDGFLSSLSHSDELNDHSFSSLRNRLCPTSG